jgi:WD40 repeat protein
VENDSEKLIALLERFEQEKGITELHHFCSEQLKNKGALKLTHRFGHITDMVAFGLSKDGNYLATGSWVGENYDEGGELMIWDVRTGRCVNNLDNVNGGVGWPEYPNCIQWSNDGKQLGLVINTNGFTFCRCLRRTGYFLRNRWLESSAAMLLATRR